MPIKTPHKDVRRLVTDAYLQDVHKLLLERDRLLERLSVALTISPINYSQWIGGGAVANVHANQSMTDTVAHLQELKQCYTLTAKELREHKRLIYGCRYGEVLWLRYVEKQNWGFVIKRQKRSMRALKGQIDDARLDLYHAIPEVYRRYTIPDACDDGLCL